MSNIDKQALREVAEKATKGEWWSDVVETDGEYGEGEDRVSGYHSYAVYVGHESLLDMTNSTAACIHTEWDHDYHMAWDETAKRNAEFVAAASPDTVLALLDELEAAAKQIAEMNVYRSHRISACVTACEGISTENLVNNVPIKQGLQGLNARIREADGKLEAFRQRIAELEASPSNKLPGGFSLDDAKELHANLVNGHISKAISGERMSPVTRNADLAWIKMQLVSAAWFVQASIEAHSAAGIKGSE